MTVRHLGDNHYHALSAIHIEGNTKFSQTIHLHKLQTAWAWIITTSFRPSTTCFWIRKHRYKLQQLQTAAKLPAIHAVSPSTFSWKFSLSCLESNSWRLSCWTLGLNMLKHMQYTRDASEIRGENLFSLVQIPLLGQVLGMLDDRQELEPSISTIFEEKSHPNMVS